MNHPIDKRRSVRLATSNYFSATFLVTVVTSDRRKTFGHISDGAMHRSALGELVETEIANMSTRRERVEVDAHIVMPNHIHVVVSLSHGREITDYVEGTLEDNSLGSMIGGFKSGVTRLARRQGLVRQREPVWQRSFHESMLRTEQAILDACTYVERNPMWWKWDELNGR